MKPTLYLILLLANTFFVSCTTPNIGGNPSAENPDVAGTSISAATETQPPKESTADSAERSDGIAVTPLSFTGNGSTFLEAIAQVAGEQGSPLNHHFVETMATDAVIWQGEALTYSDSIIFMLQAVHGQQALRIDAPTKTTIEAISAHLPESTIPGSTINDSLPALYPEIQFVRARLGSSGSWSFDVTLAYPDTGWEDYADGWHIETPVGKILGTRVLLHPHVNEQPFTRSLGGVTIPADVAEIQVRSHSLVHGYSTEALTIPLQPGAKAEVYVVE